MDYVKFGKTGLGVSRLCIGCMTYGIPNRGAHPWTLDEEQSRPLIKQAVELGINMRPGPNGAGLSRKATVCAVSEPTSSIFIRFIDGTRWSRSRRRWKRSTTS
jgi:hypothetical protein